MNLREKKVRTVRVGTRRARLLRARAAGRVRDIRRTEWRGCDMHPAGWLGARSVTLPGPWSAEISISSAVEQSCGVNPEAADPLSKQPGPPHGGFGEASPFTNDAAFVSGFGLARRSLFKLLRDGPPDDWAIAAVKRE